MPRGVAVTRHAISCSSMLASLHFVGTTGRHHTNYRRSRSAFSSSAAREAFQPTKCSRSEPPSAKIYPKSDVKSDEVPARTGDNGRVLKAKTRGKPRILVSKTTPHGQQLSDDSHGNTQVLSESGAKSGAADELSELLAIWSTLGESDREALLSMARGMVGRREVSL